MADLDFNKETLAQLKKHPPPQTELLKGGNGDQNQAYLECSIVEVTTKRTMLGGPLLLPASYMTLDKVTAPIVLVLPSMKVGNGSYSFLSPGRGGNGPKIGLCEI